MNALKQVRRRLGLGLRELARDADVGKDVVSRIETGRVQPVNVSYGDIVRLFRALKRAGLTRTKLEDIFPVAAA